ncbi:hypothetical protein D3C86_1099390 [compost metagenome]
MGACASGKRISKALLHGILRHGLGDHAGAYAEIDDDFGVRRHEDHHHAMVFGKPPPDLRAGLSVGKIDVDEGDIGAAAKRHGLFQPVGDADDISLFFRLQNGILYIHGDEEFVFHDQHTRLFRAETRFVLQDVCQHMPVSILCASEHRTEKCSAVFGPSMRQLCLEREGPVPFYLPPLQRGRQANTCRRNSFQSEINIVNGV